MIKGSKLKLSRHFKGDVELGKMQNVYTITAMTGASIPTTSSTEAKSIKVKLPGDDEEDKTHFGMQVIKRA